MYIYIYKHSKCGEIIYTMNRMTKQRFSRSLLSLVIRTIIDKFSLVNRRCQMNLQQVYTTLIQRRLDSYTSIERSLNLRPTDRPSV